MKDISFLIPSVRTEFLRIVVNNIINFMRETDYTYEILVISPYEIPVDINCILIKDQRLGIVNAINLGVAVANGQYIFGLNDKWIPDNKILKAITLLESDIFKNRKYKMTGINAAPNFNYSITAMPMIGSESAPHLNLPEELKHPRFLEQKHKYAIMGFPVITIDTIKNHFQGYFFHPRFKNHYADNWISFYVGEMGEFPLVCEDTMMQIIPSPSTSNTDSYDYQVFCDLSTNLIRGNNKNYV